jgi:hypothetical protein
MWWMTRRAPVHNVVDDAASTGTQPRLQQRRNLLLGDAAVGVGVVRVEQLPHLAIPAQVEFESKIEAELKALMF